MQIAKHIKLIKGSSILNIAQRVEALRNEGKKIFSLTVGEPDFKAPEPARNAAIKAIESGNDRYPPTAGVLELKSAIIEKLKRDNKLDYKTSDIIATIGSKQALSLSLQALLNAEDEVIIFRPYYTTYPEIISLYGGTTRFINCNSKLRPDIEHFRETINAKTKAVILNSPSNPAGIVYSIKELESIAEILLKHPEIAVLSDDIYEHLTYDGNKFRSILEIAPELYNRTLVLNGLSKAHSMTGWRIGYIACRNQEMIQALDNIQSHTIVGHSPIIQAGAAAALNMDQALIKEHLAIFHARRNVVLETLQKSKLIVEASEGAFYIFASIKKLIGGVTLAGEIIKNDLSFCQQLLEEEGVAVVPGSFFGMENYIRISYACDIEVLKEATKKISEFCEKIITLSSTISEVSLRRLPELDPAQQAAS